MTDDPRKKLKDAAQEIDIGLNGLLGALGDAIGEMVTKLEDGHSGALSRDHVFETEKGPIRAHAGVRLRMGGLDAGSGSHPAPKPVNPNRSSPNQPVSPKPKTLEYDVFEEKNGWIFAADLPGVSAEELQLTHEGSLLELKTTGARLFTASVDLECEFDFEQIETRLQNGVLTLTIPKKA